MPRLPFLVPLFSLLASAATIAAQAPAFSTNTYWQLHRVDSPAISSDGKLIAYTRWTADSVSNSWLPEIWQMDANGEKGALLVAGSNPSWSPDGTRLAYLADIDGKTRLVVRTLKSGQVRVLSQGERPPDEFRWSPDGKFLVYRQWVSGAVAPANPLATKFSAGAASPLIQWTLLQNGPGAAGSRRHLFLVAADSGAPRELTSGSMQVGTDNGGGSAASFSWFPDGRNIAFDGNDSPDADQEFHNSAIFFVSISDAGVGRLTPSRGFWHSPVVSGDGRWVAYLGAPESARSSDVEELYIMQPNGSGVRSLTRTLQRDPVGVLWAPDNQSLWFSAEDRGAINAFTATLATPSVVKQATNGNHSVIVADLTGKDGGYGVAVRSGLMNPSEIVRFALKRPSDLKTITNINAAVLAPLALGETEEIGVNVAGRPVMGQLFRPAGFDPARKYPLVVEFHDGPHAMFAASFDPTIHLLNAAGFQVLRMNPAGSTGYGPELAALTAFPGQEVKDVVAGINAVIATGSVDTTRISLSGCGAGAVSVLELLSTATRFGRSSVECTGGGWLAMSGMSGPTSRSGFLVKRPMWEDPLVWAEHSPLRYTGAVRSPLLIMGGACDFAAPFDIGRPLFAALLVRRVESVSLEFPDECQGTTTRPGNWVKSIMARISWYGGSAR